MTEQSAYAPRVDDLCLGATEPKKVVHHESCPHARRPYGFARRFDTVEAFCEELRTTGAVRWHHFCQACCGDVDDVMQHVLRRPSMPAEPHKDAPSRNYGAKVCGACGSRDGVTVDDSGTAWCHSHICWPCANGVHNKCIGLMGWSGGKPVHCQCKEVRTDA